MGAAGKVNYGLALPVGVSPTAKSVTQAFKPILATAPKRGVAAYLENRVAGETHSSARGPHPTRRLHAYAPF